MSIKLSDMTDTFNGLANAFTGLADACNGLADAALASRLAGDFGDKIICESMMIRIRILFAGERGNGRVLGERSEPSNPSSNGLADASLARRVPA